MVYYLSHVDTHPIETANTDVLTASSDCRRERIVLEIVIRTKCADGYIR